MPTWSVRVVKPVLRITRTLHVPVNKARNQIIDSFGIRRATFSSYVVVVTVAKMECESYQPCDQQTHAHKELECQNHRSDDDQY